MKLSTAITDFDTQLRADGKSERTRQAYLRDLRKLEAWLKRDVDVSTIIPDKLARFLADGNAELRSALTVNRTKTALRVFFRFLSDAGYLSENPARLIRSTPTDRKIPGYLTVGEAKLLLATIANTSSFVATRDLAMFSLLLGTGIRLSSLVALNVCDLNLAQKTIVISAKGGREETVLLNEQLRRSLTGYLKVIGVPADVPIFFSRAGERLGPRQIQLRFKHWLQIAGITKSLSVHSLRHTFATRLYSKTGDLRLVQRALGHRHIATTEIYARVEDKALRKALENLSF